MMPSSLSRSCADTFLLRTNQTCWNPRGNTGRQYLSTLTSSWRSQLRCCTAAASDRVCQQSWKGPPTSTRPSCTTKSGFCKSRLSCSRYSRTPETWSTVSLQLGSTPMWRVNCQGTTCAGTCRAG